VSRHWYPGFATVGPASDMRSRPATPNARPKRRAGYSPEPLGHMPPVDFCNRVSPEHTYGPPKPRRLMQRQATARRVRTSLTERSPPSFLRPGVASAFRLLDPHHDDRSPQWIYPNLISPDTPCHKLVPAPAWKIDRF
jgi:hypothetical protein